MNITFLIGNGFDLNLGLKTTYKEFLGIYTKGKASDTALIKRFKGDLVRDEEMWSAAELAFGEYTRGFSGNRAAIDFSECHEDFCVKLAEYLKKEQVRGDFEKVKNAPNIFVKGLREIVEPFREAERDQIKASINNYGEGFCYNFINFNYTDTLDRIVGMVRVPEDIGERIYRNTKYNNRIGELIHVHGNVEKDMALGVDNEKQIANVDIFSNAGIEYKNQIIKPETNKANRENIDQKVHNIIKNSKLLYIYGMSLGETDARWWKRIAGAMKKDGNIHIIIHCYNAPDLQLINRRYQTFESEIRQRFLQYSGLDEDGKRSIEERIHIQGENIFIGLKGIANRKTKG